jgi:aryl-alcohol dehydrogenase-like predicted oxidoreductase
MSDRWTADVVRVYYGERNFRRQARARDLALAKGATATQIALAWVLHQGDNVFAVIGPRSIPEMQELFEAFAIRLSSEEIAWLNLETDG